MIVDSLFGDLAARQNLQAMIDNSIDVFQSQSIWRRFFDWAIPTQNLTFETAIGRSRILAAASIVDIDSPGPVRSPHKLELLSGKIPTMKQANVLNQSDYRALLALANLPISQEARKQALIQKLYDIIREASISTDIRLDIMGLQAISSFKIDVTVTGNPDGVAYGEVNLLPQADQTRGVSQVWSNSAADPFKDIEDVVTYAASKGIRFASILIDNETWMQMKKLNAVKEAITGYMNPGSNARFLVTEAVINEYLVSNRLPQIEIINERRGIEADGKTTTINPFKKENVVFLPAGKLGLVHNALAIEEMEPVQGINYAKYDRTLLAQWRENNPWREYTQVELNAFPALKAIDGIYHLTTNIAA